MSHPRGLEPASGGAYAYLACGVQPSTPEDRPPIGRVPAAARARAERGPLPQQPSGRGPATRYGGHHARLSYPSRRRAQRGPPAAHAGRARGRPAAWHPRRRAGPGRLRVPDGRRPQGHPDGHPAGGSERRRLRPARLHRTGNGRRPRRRHPGRWRGWRRRRGGRRPRRGDVRAGHGLRGVGTVGAHPAAHAPSAPLPGTDAARGDVGRGGAPVRGHRNRSG